VKNAKQVRRFALAEKVSALRSEEDFAEHAAKGDIKKALQVLKRAGKDKTPVGDETAPEGTAPSLSEGGNKSPDLGLMHQLVLDGFPRPSPSTGRRPRFTRGTPALSPRPSCAMAC
jgi:hypothetical protein